MRKAFSSAKNYSKLRLRIGLGATRNQSKGHAGIERISTSCDGRKLLCIIQKILVYWAVSNVSENKGNEVVPLTASKRRSEKSVRDNCSSMSHIFRHSYLGNKNFSRPLAFIQLNRIKCNGPSFGRRKYFCNNYLLFSAKSDIVGGNNSVYHRLQPKVAILSTK